MVNKLFKKDDKNVSYYYCGKLGHKSFVCNSRNTSKTKNIQISKGSIMTNHEGSKKAWIPKNA